RWRSWSSRWRTTPSPGTGWSGAGRLAAEGVPCTGYNPRRWQLRHTPRPNGASFPSCAVASEASPVGSPSPSRGAWPQASGDQGRPVTDSVEQGPAGDARPQVHPGLAGFWRSLVERFVRALARLRLPGATVLPVAGAVVGLYGGLAAGVFANLIGVVGGVVFGWPQVLDIVRRGSETRAALRESLAHAHWHPEYLVIGV